jgi:hypothetical protein
MFDTLSKHRHSSLFLALVLSIGVSGTVATPAYAKPDANVSSLKLAGPSAVGLDAESVQALVAGMQASIDAGQIPGAVLMIANKDQVGVLESVVLRAQTTRHP